MGHSQAKKVATHQRIVEVAAKRFRERGIEGVSIADLMKEAGLTVGGFYKHFDSRDELVREAFEHALHDIEQWEAAIPVAPRQAMRSYMSESHRDNVAAGCPISALVNDMSRGTDETREVFSDRVRKIIELISGASPAKENAKKRTEALLIMSACVGAVALSRAVSDPKLSNQILEGSLSEILEILSPRRSI
ncbi:TetR family transcriptional regulator [Caballeronia arationis]|jgi:TetR/AcrR family transcriptional repressor of nem operon|uniref:Transcriptional regulator, TetR family n=1 Tax=Caballeronia arationis TaxID=1777142 RepID=A0A7Z7I5N1_9BURK|nr:TetR/AcrR family transcriptional regulator [Caballeronia arationis]SAK83038.1 TetR family transcriptional regulator [Caballeronia arationis]SOE62637.1 transcriptional regulator, TetR family [Caballeronia arationis]